VRELLNEPFLPYTADELLPHFVNYDAEGENPEKYLTKWRERIAKAPSKDPDWLERDETFWTANALMAIYQKADCADRWRVIMSKLFGPIPPTTKRLEWSDLVRPDLRLFFEVGLPSPLPYRSWLSNHLDDRQVLAKRREMANSKAESLEGRTHLDALLLSPTSGFALHFEAKVLSDIDTHITYDSLRNQLARNIDSMAAPASSNHCILGKRDPDRSFMVMLTPELFRRNWRSRLYGHLVREYASDPSAIQRDLPHLDGLTCAALSRRVGWLTFEDLRSAEPTVCPWLAPDETTSQAQDTA
jgi:hypothetical protein